MPVVIKRLQGEYPGPQQLTRFHHEYEITRELDTHFVIKTYGLEKQANVWTLICEDIRGDSLNHVLAAQKLDLAVFLHLAIQMSNALEELHRHNIIHRDIKPANIIVNLNTRQAKLTDFSISTRTQNDNQIISPPGIMEGTLIYMSPEQTGRMNRVVDYRSDFYSLGAVFYEILAGRPPFQSSDSMELVHAHIARTPRAVHERSRDVPMMVSNIIAKLLAKMPEDRYQSAHGLKVDFQICLQQFEQNGRIEVFTCGEHDVAEHFSMPERLYGRAGEMAQLMNAFQKAQQEQNTQFVLISGPAGFGKTMLATQMDRHVTAQGGYFVSGDFDEVERNVPYSALLDAFTALIQQLLTESENALEAWRDKLNDALGNNSSLIISILPELALILGEQNTSSILEEATPESTENRSILLSDNSCRCFVHRNTRWLSFLMTCTGWTQQHPVCSNYCWKVIRHPRCC